MGLFSFKINSSNKIFAHRLKRYRDAQKQRPYDFRIQIKIAELCREYGKNEEAIEEYLHAAEQIKNKNHYQVICSIYNNILLLEPGKKDVYFFLSL